MAYNHAGLRVKMAKVKIAEEPIKISLFYFDPNYFEKDREKTG
jgi:hypothetical protein